MPAPRFLFLVGRDKFAMKIPAWIAIASVVTSLTCQPGIAQEAPPAGSAQPLNVEQLFANVCGWCHSGAGRVAGKGPQLMNTERTDEYIRNRIKMGKSGAMPAFGTQFSDKDIDAIIIYIRDLKPEEG